MPSRAALARVLTVLMQLGAIAGAAAGVLKADGTAAQMERGSEAERIAHAQSEVWIREQWAAQVHATAEVHGEVVALRAQVEAMAAERAAWRAARAARGMAPPPEPPSIQPAHAAAAYEQRAREAMPEKPAPSDPRVQSALAE